LSQRIGDAVRPVRLSIHLPDRSVDAPLSGAGEARERNGVNLTATQRQAIAARGNVLVVAGAGTGKTRTLVERCLACLLDARAPASLDEVLVVTFTEAAAAEMRQRLRAGLERRLKEVPTDTRCREQLALFDTAHIGTLHSFCL